MAGYKGSLRISCLLAEFLLLSGAENNTEVVNLNKTQNEYSTNLLYICI